MNAISRGRESCSLIHMCGVEVDSDLTIVMVVVMVGEYDRTFHLARTIKIRDERM
jgi:hypothetical protein